MKKFLPPLVITSTIWIILAFFLSLGLFSSWQNKLADTLFTPQTPSEKIVIIAIDDKSIQAIGRWPWIRTVHADLLNTLSKGEPQAIGIDISFLEPENPKTDSDLQSAIDKAGNITLASEVVNNNLLSPIYSAKTGIVNTISNEDGVTRHALYNFQNTQHFSSQILGENTNPPLEGNLLRINFTGPPNTFQTYSYIDVLKGIIPPETFKGKIVLIGATAPDLHDNQMVPVSGGIPMSGVEIQANILQTLMNHSFLTPEKPSLTLVSIAALSLLTATTLSFLGIFAGIFFVFLTLTAYIIFAIFFFDRGTILNLIYPPLAILGAGTSDLVYKYFSEYRQKRFVKKALSFYLSKPVMNQILENPSKLTLGGERQEITVLFSDIAGFTTISETLSPDVLARLLNQYLSSMTNIVFKHEGVLDKYIGDAVMAFWGAPIKTKDHAQRACRAALEMQEKIKILSKDWEKEGVKDFHARIGINTGEMVVGNMGSDVRFDYTLIGDNVNLGSRLEGINKVYGTLITISQNTFNQIKGKFTTRKLDNVAVKGKKKGMVIYELAKHNKDFLKSFEQARSLYEKGDFKKALTLFKSLLKDYPKDSPTNLYITRCQNLIKHKPKNWDGIFHAETK